MIHKTLYPAALKQWLTIGFLLTLVTASFMPQKACSQNKKGRKTAANQAAFSSGRYCNLFREAGYSLAAIDEKIAKAYHDVFEGPNRVYVEAGDAMGYVSDIKNHDARTEGFSDGMMIAGQLNKKDVFDRIWR